MVDAVVDFVRRKQPKFVCSIKILIFQTAMMTEFHSSMKKREGVQVQEKGLFTFLKGMCLKNLDLPTILICSTEDERMIY